MKPSVKQLGIMLHEGGFVKKPFTTADLKAGRVPNVGNETYGKKSFVYLYTGSPEKRKKVEAFLRKRGVTSVHKDYSPGYGTAEVGVQYFRGHHFVKCLICQITNHPSRITNTGRVHDARYAGHLFFYLFYCHLEFRIDRNIGLEHANPNSLIFQT